MNELLLVSLIYSIFAVDHIAAGQFMISRPLVLGAFFGWLIQRPLVGLMMGGTVEFLWVQVIPAGGIWPIDTMMIAGLCLFWTKGAPLPGAAVFALGLVLAIPCGIVSRHVDILLRHMNSSFSERIIAGFEKGRENALSRGVWLALGIWFLKSFALFFIFAGIGQHLLREFMVRCSAQLAHAFDFAGQMLLLVSLIALLHFFMQRMMNTLAGFGQKAKSMIPGMKP